MIVGNTVAGVILSTDRLRPNGEFNLNGTRASKKKSYRPLFCCEIIRELVSRGFSLLALREQADRKVNDHGR